MVARRDLVFGGCAGILLGAGCDLFKRTCKPGEPPPALVITLIGRERLNRDEGARSLPTWVRVFQLTTAAGFERLAFDELWEGGEERLGDALLGFEERPVYPGERVAVELARDEGARVVGAAALFRRPTGGSWRGIHPLRAAPRCEPKGGGAEREELFVIVEESALRLGAIDPEAKPRSQGRGRGRRREGEVKER